MAIPSDPATSASAASRSTPSPAAASKGKEREQRSSGSDARRLASSHYSSGADEWEEESEDGHGDGEAEGEGSSKEQWRQMFDRSFNESRASSLGHASMATKASKPPVIDPQPQKGDDDDDEPKGGHDGRARRRPHPANWRMSGMLAKSSSNTTLGRDATELIHGYLNFTARRGGAVRTFALPPSSIDGLSYETLARILDLDRRIEDSSWAEKGKRKGKSRIKPASSSGGTGASSAYTSFFTGGRNREQPVIYIEHLVDPTAPGDRRTSRPYTKWSKLAPWPHDSLQGFLIADFFRRQVGRDQWVNLVVKEKGQGPPTDDEGFGPSGLSRIGKGLSRLSWGLGSLFNGLDSPLRSPASPGAVGREQTVKRQQYLQLKDNLLDDSEGGSGDTATSRLREAPAETPWPPASPTLPRWLRSVWPFGGAAATASNQQRADATGLEVEPAHRAVARPPQVSEQDAPELDINAITTEAAATAAARAKATSATRSAASATSSASPPQTRPRRRSLLVSDTLRQAYLEGKARLSGTTTAADTPTDASAPRSLPRPRLRQGLTHLGKAIVSPFAIALNLRPPTHANHFPSRDDNDDGDSDAFNRRERERLNKRAWLPPPAAKPQAGKSLAKFVSFRSLTPSRTSTSSATPATATSPSSSRDVAALPRGARGAAVAALPKSPLSPHQQQANRDRPAPGPLLPAPALAPSSVTARPSSPLAPPDHRRLIERTDLSVRNWRPSIALPPPGSTATVTTSSPEQWQALAAQAAHAGPAAGLPALGAGTSGRFSRRRSSKKKKQLHQQQHLGPPPKQAFPSSSSARGVNDYKAAPVPTEQESTARRVPLNSTLEILDIVEALGTDPPNSSRDRDAAPRPTSPSRAESDVVVASWDVNAAVVGEIEDEVLSTDDEEEEEEAQRSSGGGADAPREGEKHSILVSPMKRSGEAGQGVRVDTPLVPLLAGRRSTNNGGGGLFRKGSTASATSSGSGTGSKLMRKKPSAWKRRFGGGAATRGRRVSAAPGAGGAAGDENDAAEAVAAPQPAAWLSSSTSSLPDANGQGGVGKPNSSSQDQQEQQKGRQPPSQQHVIRRTASLLAVRNSNGNGNGTGQRDSLTPPSRSSSLRRRDREGGEEGRATATSDRRSGSRGADESDGKKRDAALVSTVAGVGGAQPVRSAEDATRDYMRRAWGDGDGAKAMGNV